MENDKGNSSLLISSRLAEVLQSLGVDNIAPSSWDVNVNEVECTLNISWNRENKKHRDSAVKLSSNETVYCVTGNSTGNSSSDGESRNSKTQTKDKNVQANSNVSQESERDDIENGGDANVPVSRTSHSNRSHGNNHLVYNGLSNDRLHNNKATCSCGEQFIFKERAIKHILFSCPVSLCFRIDLDLRIHDVIDKWQDEEQRILGRKWWHTYKTSGVPDIMGTYPVASVDQLYEMINSFIAKAGTNKLLDQNNNRFVLIKGLEELPYELGPLIG